MLPCRFARRKNAGWRGSKASQAEVVGPRRTPRSARRRSSGRLRPSRARSPRTPVGRRVRARRPAAGECRRAKEPPAAHRLPAARHHLAPRDDRLREVAAIAGQTPHQPGLKKRQGASRPPPANSAAGKRRTPWLAAPTQLHVAPATIGEVSARRTAPSRLAPHVAPGGDRAAGGSDRRGPAAGLAGPEHAREGAARSPPANSVARTRSMP